MAKAMKAHEDALHMASGHLRDIRTEVENLRSRSAELTTEIAEAYSEGADTKKDARALKKEREEVDADRKRAEAELALMTEAVSKARRKVGREKIAQALAEHDRLAKDVEAVGSEVEEAAWKLAEAWERFRATAGEVEDVRDEVRKIGRQYKTGDTPPPRAAALLGHRRRLLLGMETVVTGLKLMTTDRAREESPNEPRTFLEAQKIRGASLETVKAGRLTTAAS